MRARRLTPIRRLAPGLTAISLGLLSARCGGSTTAVTSASPVPRCGVTLEIANSTLPASGGSGRIAVTAERECPWSATSDAAWLTLVGQSNGQGNGAVEFSVTRNPDPVARRGRVALNDKGADITQSAAECTFSLREPSANFPQAGGSGTVTLVPSSQLCTWAASADAEWITFTSAISGTGNASVRFNVAASAGPPRTATITIAGQRFSVMQSEGCSYTITPSSQSFGASGGTGTLAVTTAAGCPWTAGSNANWISIAQGATGSGPGIVTFAVAPTSGPARTGTLVAGGQAFTVTQNAGCSFQVSPLSHTVPPAVGTGMVTVASAAGCSWTASSDASWLTISGGASGSGNGVVTFAAAATSGPARTGTLTIADNRVTVTQSQGCTYAIDPTSQSVGAAGGTGTVAVTAASGCAWTAASGAEWVTITDGRTGSGNGTVRFTVAATNGPSRSATLTIAGHSFTVNQGQGCAFSLVPDTATIGAAGGGPSFEVRTASGCAWTAATTAPWISISQGASGSGNGTVNLSVAANTGPPRSGTVTAGGVTFTLNQESGCSYTVTPDVIDAPATGGVTTLQVATAAACTWTASSGVQWTAITRGAAGTGHGAVDVTVEPNSGAERAGNVLVAGRTIAVRQAGACVYTLESPGVTMPASGGPRSVGVTTTAGCNWTATSQVPWIAVAGTYPVTGPGVVQFTVEANSSGAQRVGTISIAGQIFTVTQMP